MQTESGLNSPSEIVLNYASFGRRVLAFLLDSLFLAILTAIGFNVIPFVGAAIVWFFYAPILEASEIRATLGKHLMGIQVSDAMGRRLSLSAALIRNILKIVSTAIFFLGHVVALFSRRRQTMHDMLAETFVVYGRSESHIGDAWLRTSKDLFKGISLPSGLNNTPSAQDQSFVTQLERLQALRNSGALSEQEFEIAKQKVLDAQGEQTHSRF